METVGFVNDKTMFDAEVIRHVEELQRQTTDPLLFAARHWQGDAEQGGDANGDYNQTFEVDEEHDTSTTPEKKHFKSNEVDSPDVIPLTHFLTYPYQRKLTTKTMREQLICEMSHGLGIAQCEHGVVTHDGGRKNYWVPCDKYDVKAREQDTCPIEEALQSVRNLVLEVRYNLADQ